jgi:hypothetical protein
MPNTAPVLRRDNPSISSLSAIHLSSGVSLSNASANASLSSSVSSIGRMPVDAPGTSSINAWRWVKGRKSEVHPITLGNPADAIHANLSGA